MDNDAFPQSGRKQLIRICQGREHVLLNGLFEWRKEDIFADQ